MTQDSRLAIDTNAQTAADERNMLDSTEGTHRAQPEKA
jgi:hypothetical protein